MLTSKGRHKEKVSLKKYGDYNSDIRTLSRNTNPKYTLNPLSHRE
jgi:hypothetical protein